MTKREILINKCKIYIVTYSLVYRALKLYLVYYRNRFSLNGAVLIKYTAVVVNVIYYHNTYNFGF